MSNEQQKRELSRIKIEKDSLLPFNKVKVIGLEYERIICNHLTDILDQLFDDYAGCRIVMDMATNSLKIAAYFVTSDSIERNMKKTINTENAAFKAMPVNSIVQTINNAGKFALSERAQDILAYYVPASFLDKQNNIKQDIVNYLPDNGRTYRVIALDILKVVSTLYGYDESEIIVDIKPNSIYQGSALYSIELAEVDDVNKFSYLAPTYQQPGSAVLF